MEGLTTPTGGIGTAASATRGESGPVVKSLAVTIRYVDAGIVLAPPPVGAIPGVSADEAFASVCQPSCFDAGIGPVVRLVSFSDSQYGTLDAQGQVIHPFQARLAWAISWRTGTCPSSGPPGAKVVTETCDHVIFVDAADGKYLIAYEGPPAT